MLQSSIILVVAGLSLLGYIFAVRKNDKLKAKQKLIIKIIAGVFIPVYVCRLFTIDIFDTMTINLENDMFSPFVNFLMTSLRWLSLAGVLVTLVAPFYKVRVLDNLLAYFVPVMTLLNIIFFKSNIIAMLGRQNYDMFSLRAVQFGVELTLSAIISGIYLYNKISSRDFAVIKSDLKMMLAVLPCLLLAIMPPSTLMTFFGIPNIDATGFSLSHRLLIYTSFLVPILLYIFLKDKPKESKHGAMVVMAVAGFIAYFYFHDSHFTLGELPIHLCNLAIILMLFSIIFRLKGLFYFNYLINVFGAISAILFPNTTGALFLRGNVYFWYNHFYAFFLPIICVAIRDFPRPTFPMVSKAIGVFTVFFAFMIVCNVVFVNYDSGVDYFFLNGDFLIDKFPFLRDLKYKFIYSYVYNGFHLTFYPLYWIVFYIGYIGFVFLTWLIYSKLFAVADSHYELHKLKLHKKVDHLLLLRELKGRPITEPLNLEGKGMIKITNFTKQYGGSAVKAVDDFNLEIHDGEIFGFLGHNGAGKSTTIKCLVGIQTITSGKIEICGYDISKQPLEAKLNIGYVPDNHSVYEKLTGREYVNYVADLFLVSKADRTERLEKYIKMFKLEEAIDRQIKGYSHGMKQKITVISALIHNPKVWVLDEPLTGLDPTSAYQIKECMAEHAKNGNIVFFSSHIIDVVEKICDRIAIINGGVLKCVHSVADLKAKGVSLEKLYLKYVEEKADYVDIDTLKEIKGDSEVQVADVE